jgi:hypothetical protein
MEHAALDYHPEFLLARLQKLQRSYGGRPFGVEFQRLTEVS